ncbi:hypothetical protein ma499 [Moumouvirus australiensis]|uniref:Uncharacterized protein n=1 Tax=Moumouvirus australiensis TaxID=2109587 RepID=A0A2P1ELX6_9VIRU|nr:hypothetical protein QKC55_gp406 [Moumouvirus australiensis]AVL94885.1 hypothetical protein ma499 [Moumouvirus australiensis]
MSVSDIISNALIEYDTAAPIIKYLLKNTYIEGEKTNNDLKRTIFRFRDKKTDKILLQTEVEILGIYYDKLNIWSWSWSQIGLTNSENYLSKEMLLYALKLGSDLSYIKSILTTSRGTIQDHIQVDINIAIASSIIKQPYIYPVTYHIQGYNLVYYFILLNKDELDKLEKLINK